MFVGHLAAAFVGKRTSRSTSLAWLVLAVMFVDLIWPLFLLAGIERVRIDPGNTAFTPLAFDHYPWTHSLLMGIAWGVALGAAASSRGVSTAGASLLAVLVASHWVLDFISHRPDLPLWPWPDGVYGLGLWHSIPATLLVEGLLWLAGILAFLRSRRPLGVSGRVALWSFLLVTTMLWASSPFSPPPPSETALLGFALFSWIVVPWAWWIERTSETRTTTPTGSPAPSSRVAGSRRA